MSNSILIVEEDATLADTIRQYLESHRWEAHVAYNCEQGLSKLENVHPDIVLTAHMLPGKSGLDVITSALAMDPQIKTVMMADQGGEQVAVDAMKAGAFYCLPKPVSLAQLDVVLEKAMLQSQIETRLAILQRYKSRGVVHSGSLASIIGESPVMRTAKARAQQVLEAEKSIDDADLPAILITGEAGTGKELLARALHFESARNHRPFIEINCASVPPALLEAELFGYERGAFRDAKERRIGLVEAADGGTLFLDDISELDPSIQGKLLTLLERKTFHRLGSARERAVNIRVLSATNRDLERLIRRGRFRNDLYFRLSAITLSMPPLRSTGSDILRIARFYLQSHAQRHGKEGLRFTPEAEELLRGYNWPGNVRELRDILEQTVRQAREEWITPSQIAISDAVRRDFEPDEDNRADAGSHGNALSEAEEDLVRKTLERSDWNVSKSARRLGLSRDMLRYRIQKFGLVRPAE
jgi:DNA-binding NtrC family response regulator